MPQFVGAGDHLRLEVTAANPGVGDGDFFRDIAQYFPLIPHFVQGNSFIFTQGVIGGVIAVWNAAFLVGQIFWLVLMALRLL